TYSRIAPRLSVIALTSSSDRRRRASNASSRTSSAVMRDIGARRIFTTISRRHPRRVRCGARDDSLQGPWEGPRTLPRWCAARDTDLTSPALATRGSSVDLEELGGVGVGLGASPTPSAVIRTFPRVYPDGAGVVGGVVGEAAAQPIASLPEHVSVFSAESE